jgi:hypothetical protein
MSECLNQFIVAASLAGELESAGVFTIDLDKAGDKFSKFQLVDPYLYVAHLVAAAVLGGAEHLQISKSHNSVTFKFDGASYSQEELENLNAYRLVGQVTDRRLQELAIAMSGAQGTGPSTIIFQSVDSNRQGFRLEIGQDTQVVTRLESGSPAGQELVLGYALTIDRLAGLFEKQCPERDVLSRFCSRAPMQLRSDLDFLSNPDFSPQNYIAWKTWSPKGGYRPGPPSQELGFTKTSTWEHPLTAVLCLTNPIFAEVQGVTFVLNGVSFKREFTVLNCPYACGLVYVQHLNKNVSHTDIVEDDAYRQVVEVLIQSVDELWLDLACSGRSIPKGHEARVLQYLKSRYPESDRPIPIRRYLVQMELDKKFLDIRRCQTFLDDAERFEQEDDLQQAELIRTKVVESMNRSMAKRYAPVLDKTILQLSSVRTRALSDLDGQPNRQAEDLDRCLRALAGERPVLPSGPLGGWSQLRWVLVQCLLGDPESAKAELAALEDMPDWQIFLRAELAGDAQLYLEAAEAGGSSFFWHEAAAALRAARKFEQSFECRKRAFRLGGASNHYFIHQMAREASGKLSFPTWVQWSIRAQFYTKPDRRIVELEKSLAANRILPKYALEALNQYADTTTEFTYLSHLIVWNWRQNPEVKPETSLQLQARSLLRRMISVSHAGIELRKDAITSP